MNRAPWRFGLFFFVRPAFLNQAFDQGEQEKGNSDDTGRKPYRGTEASELFQGHIIPPWLSQCGRIPLHCHAYAEDYNQQQANKHGNGTGFSAVHTGIPQLRYFL